MPGTSRSSVVVIDAYALRRAGIAALLEPWATTAGLLIVPVSPIELSPELVEGIAPVFVIFSVGGTSLHAEHLARWAADIARLLPEVPCLVLSDRAEPEEAVLAAQLGQQAFMTTSVDPRVALQAFAFVIGGGTFFPREALLQGRQWREPALEGASDELTPRQAQVLARLRLGRSNKLIARDLDMQESTVKVHVREIMRKLGAHNRTEAALRAPQFGIVEIALESEHSATPAREMPLSSVSPIDHLGWPRSPGARRN